MLTVRDYCKCCRSTIASPVIADIDGRARHRHLNQLEAFRNSKHGCTLHAVISRKNTNRLCSTACLTAMRWHCMIQLSLCIA